MPIVWQEGYNLGFKIIDNQHREFVEALNSGYDLVQSGKFNKKMSELFKRLRKYAKDHFATEEKYFDEFHFSGTKRHKEVHANFVLRLNELEKEYEKNRNDDGGLAIIDFLENWLLDHLADMDKKYVSCFQKHGLK